MYIYAILLGYSLDLLSGHVFSAPSVSILLIAIQIQLLEKLKYNKKHIG